MIIKRKTLAFSALLLCFGCLAGACDSAGDNEQPGPSVDPGMSSTPASTPGPPVRDPATPPGGLTQWVADIRAALVEVQAKLPGDIHAARQVAVNSYVHRQEWLEHYYGTHGTLVGNSAATLGDAVMDAEARYHELIVLLSSDSPSRSAVDSLISALNVEYDRVLSEAQKSPVAPVPDAPAGARVPATTSTMQG